MIRLPETIEARRTRIRHHAATEDDRAWLRIVRRPANSHASGPYVCDCRCRCHVRTALPGSGAAAGSCGLGIDLNVLDCERGCRSAHILASECQLDETRGGAHV